MFCEEGGPGPVQIIHAAVPGRLRLRVKGLHRSLPTASRLRSGLARFADVRGAWPNVATGNVLVLFDPALAATVILDRVIGVVCGTPAESEAEDNRTAGPHWHTLSCQTVADALTTSLHHGLTTAEAERRLAAAGPNRLPDPVGRGSLEILAAQFQALPSVLLGAAGVVSLFTGGIVQAAAIFAVLALNGGIGFAVESRSERTIRASGRMEPSSATVLRDGLRSKIPADQLVPGDVILLARGATVPADARVCQAHDFSLDEALLTGESLPVAKDAAPLPGWTLPLSARRNMLYRGTVVTGGTGTALVVATGAETEIGRLQRILGGTVRSPTPMERALDVLGRQLTWLSLAFCGGVVVAGVMRGLAFRVVGHAAIALAVAAIPEGLPAVASTTLARGVEVMRRRNVVVRRLDAIETLGAVEVLCFDKTGTLTFNRMSVAAVAFGGEVLEIDAIDMPVAARNPVLRKLLEIGLLCSDVTIDPDDGTLTGSETEIAILRLAESGGLNSVQLRRDQPVIAVRQRSESHRFMATNHALPNGTELTAVKGDPLDLLARCDRELRPNGAIRLSDERRDAIQGANSRLAERALRVLGFAFGTSPWGEDGPVSSLIWVGLAGLADAVRPDAASLIRDLQDAGIHAVVLTGDQVGTARAVANQLGINGQATSVVVEASEIDGLAPEMLAEIARRVHVFARVSPAEKLRIVQALQQSSLVVGMVGDGFNDSPALKAADVGVAIGATGVEAARDAADIVMQTDDLGAITFGVEQGRAAHANVRRATNYLVGTNLSEIGVVTAGVAAGWSEPLSAAQLLWINLLSDVLPAVGLAYEPPDPSLMHRPPPRAPDRMILAGADAGRLAMEAGVMAAGALASSAWGALRFGSGEQARTMGFGSLVLGQLLHTLNRQAPAASLTGNRVLCSALVLSFGLQALALFIPGLRQVLGIVPLGPVETAVTLAGGVAPYLINRMVRPSQSSLLPPEVGAASRPALRSLIISN